MPQLDAVLPFVFNHQVIIIESLFASILAIIILWLFTHLRQESEVRDQKKELRDIEAVLKRVLETTNLKTVGGPLPTPGSGAEAIAAKPTSEASTPAKPVPLAITPLTSVAAPTTPTPAAAPAAPASTTPQAIPAPQAIMEKTQAEISAAAAVIAAGTTIDGAKAPSEGAPASTAAAIDKAEVFGADEKSKRLAEVAEASSQVQAALEEAKTPPTSSAEIDELQNKLAQLEAKLREYEIIEDDIANLSIYKNENDRLKSEIEQLRASLPTKAEVQAPKAVPLSSIADPASLIDQGHTVATGTSVAELIQTQKSEDGEKLITEFQSFMKGKD